VAGAAIIDVAPAARRPDQGEALSQSGGDQLDRLRPALEDFFVVPVQNLQAAADFPADDGHAVPAVGEPAG
jgi:hypothetical protein